MMVHHSVNQASLFELLRDSKHLRWTVYFLKKTCHYSAGTADGFSFHILKFQGYLGKKKPLCTLSPNPNILLAWKINSRPIVCIHLLPTRKSSLSCIARGGGKSHPDRSKTSRGGQKKPLQSRPGSVNPSPEWLYSQWQSASARETQHMRQLALFKKYNTTQAVPHMGTCRTRLARRATTSHFISCQLTPHLSGLGYATYIPTHKKKTNHGWIKHMITYDSIAGVSGEEEQHCGAKYSRKQWWSAQKRIFS